MLEGGKSTVLVLDYIKERKEIFSNVERRLKLKLSHKKANFCLHWRADGNTHEPKYQNVLRNLPKRA